jgi:hypothetical protein
LHVGGFAAEVPSTDGICTARALARFYAALTGEVDGHRILGPDAVSCRLRAGQGDLCGCGRAEAHVENDDALLPPTQ